MQNPIHQLRNFYMQTAAEMGKCTWPSRQELFESTMVVIVTVLMISVFVTVIDWLSSNLIKVLTF